MYRNIFESFTSVIFQINIICLKNKFETRWPGLIKETWLQAFIAIGVLSLVLDIVILIIIIIVKTADKSLYLKTKPCWSKFWLIKLKIKLCFGKQVMIEKAKVISCMQNGILYENFKNEVTVREMSQWNYR